MKALFISLIFGALVPRSHAQWQFSSDTSLQGIHRNFPRGASAFSNINEAYVESLSGGRLQRDNFQFEAKVLLRSIQSPVNTAPDDFAHPNLTPPRRLMKLYTRVGNADSQNQTIIDTGSLWASYSLNKWQFTAGRRAIGIGVLKAFPVWNRLYPVVPTVSGYMFMNNPDIVDVRWSDGAWTIAGYSIFSQYYDDYIGALELIHYGEKLESHFLAGKWWNRATAGYSGVVDTSVGIFRLETLAIANSGQGKASGQQLGVGWEKVFTAKLSMNLEYYHSSFGVDRSSRYVLQDPDPFRLLLGRDYTYPQVNYKISDFCTAEFGSLINLNDGSAMLVNQATYSLADDIEIFGAYRKPIGGGGKEFGYLNVPVLNQRAEYVEWFNVGLKMTL